MLFCTKNTLICYLVLDSEPEGWKKDMVNFRIEIEISFLKIQKIQRFDFNSENVFVHEMLEVQGWLIVWLLTYTETVADPRFSWGGASTLKVCVLTYYFAMFLPKTT